MDKKHSFKKGGSDKKEKWVPPWLAKGKDTKGKKKFADGGMVDAEDPEAQRVFREDMSEITDAERVPQRTPQRAAKASARKAAPAKSVAAARGATYAAAHKAAESAPEGLGKTRARKEAGRLQKEYEAAASPLKMDKNYRYARGGMVKSCDGIARRGKTKGRQA